jgi:hypothetical protein
VLPPTSSVASFSRASPFFINLREYYYSVPHGGSRLEGCSGEIALGRPDAEILLLTIFHRPHAMLPRPLSSECIVEGYSSNAARELALMSWGVSDPQSWRNYVDLKESRGALIADMTAYYRAHFAEADAHAMAERAWRHLVVSVTSSNSWPDDGGLTRVTGGFDVRRITPESTPEEIARIASEAWLEIEPEPRGDSFLDAGDVWTDVLLAAIHTRLPAETARAHWDRFERAVTLGLEAADNEPQRDYVNGRWRHGRDAALLAAAENASAPLIDLLLDAGADPAAVDSQGNPVSWYFDRNAIVTDPAARERIAERLAGAP